MQDERVMIKRKTQDLFYNKIGLQDLFLLWIDGTSLRLS